MVAPETTSVPATGSVRITSPSGTSSSNSSLTVNFNPDPITDNTSTVTVNVGSGVALGQHNLTITGAAGAAGNPTTTLQVTVTAPSGNNIVWEFCNSGDVPLKFWRMSGGTWSEVAPTVVGAATTFSFTVSGTQAGIAFTLSNTASALRTSQRLRQNSTLRGFGKQMREKVLAARARVTNQDVSLTTPFFDTFVLLALSSELAGFPETCSTAPTLVTKSFTVAGQAVNEQGLLGYGGVSTQLTTSITSYDVMVEAGTYDWMALFGPTPAFPYLTQNWTNYRIGRGETAPGPSVAIDRTGATAFTQTAFTVTGGAAGSFYTFTQGLEGARGPIVGFPIGDFLNQTGTGNMLFLQPADRLGTDMNSLNLINTELSGNITAGRLVTRYFGSAPPTSTDFALPAAVPPFTVAPVAGAPVPTWSVSGQTPTDYQTSDSFIAASFQGAGETSLYTIEASRGWLTANNFSTNYTLSGPVLPGFLSQWAPGAPLVDAQVIMFSSNFTTTPVAGSVFNIGFRLVQSP